MKIARAAGVRGVDEVFHPHGHNQPTVKSTTIKTCSFSSASLLQRLAAAAAAAAGVGGGRVPVATTAEEVAAAAAYQQALDDVRTAAAACKGAAGAAAAPASAAAAAATLASARAALALRKRQLAAAKKLGKVQTLAGLGSRAYWERRPPNPAWRHYPPPSTLPRDPDDPRWTTSFDPLRQRALARSFWREHGFVIFRGVLSPEECEATVSEIWDTLEARHPGLSRADPSTYTLLPSKRYGLPDEQALFTPQVVRNRQSARLYAALTVVTPPWRGPARTDAAADADDNDQNHAGGDTIVDIPNPGRDPPGPNSIVVSHDRWCMYPPSLGHPDRQTNNPGAHLDICPWQYHPRADRRYDAETDIDRLAYAGPDRARELCDFRAEINNVRLDVGGPHNQGVLNLRDNLEADGGTALVPGFHKCYRQWAEALGTWERNRVGQRRRGNAFVFGNPFDPIHKLMRRVTLRRGSLLLWNQMTVHGAVPNASSNFRVAQFVRGFRAGEMTPSRARRRGAAVRRELDRAGVQEEQLDTAMAAHVFFARENEAPASHFPGPG